MVSKLVVGLVLISFISLLSLCVSNVVAMNLMHQESCAMAEHAAMCPMTVQKHLAFWQQMLVSAGAKSIALLLLAGMALTAFSRYGLMQKVGQRLLTYLRYLFERAHLRLFDHLLQQFSQGILHPKIY